VITKGKKSPLLSEQQLIDCAKGFNNNGCNGGLPSQAFEYIKYADGLTTEKSYPYKAVDGKCAFDSKQAVANVPHGAGNIALGDEAAILQTLFSKGPVSIAFEVTEDFLNYESGVYQSENCNKDTLHVNHAGLIVGFDHDNSTNMDYWIVKNSWGINWGE